MKQRPPRQARSVLLVEDNPADVLLARRAFALHDGEHELTVIHNGREALDCLLSPGPGKPVTDRRSLGLILLDLNLSDLDGHEVLRALRADPRTVFVPVVMLTTSDEPSDVRRSYLLGANGHVCKPVDFQEFARSMDDLLAYWLRWNRTADAKEES